MLFISNNVQLTAGLSPCGLFFTGLLDELSIYNRGLASNEIQCLSSPLVVTNQPKNAFALLGGIASFGVGVSGLGPFTYQWLFNSISIADGTNGALIITNVQAANAGTYSVIVTNGIGSTVTSSNVSLTIVTAGLDDDSDGLLNETEIQLGTNPHSADTDSDGLNDYQELFVYGTSPLLADSDGDGMPDKWEIDHGLNPRFNDAADDLDGDGLSNLAEYNWSLSHPNQLLDPRTKHSTSATVSDFAVVTGAGTNQFFYDRNNRLIGAEFDRGLALAYVYDGNDNLVRQVSLKHDANTNGLPDVWEFLNGLTNNASAYTDTDGDGWTDYQEWKAGSNPRDLRSAPNLLGNPGTQIASLQLPFTPSNFVVGVGQLDGLGAEEIVLGADGNPGTNVNFLLVLIQGATTWSTQRVDVGVFGITSIAVGQLTNRPSSGIYVGLRGTTNGSGRVMEFTSNGGIWQSNLVALATNQTAFVLGVRGPDVLVSLATTNAPDGSLSAVTFATNWNLSLMDTNRSHRGLGTTASIDGLNQVALRLLDSGGIQASSAAVNGGLMAHYPLDGNAEDASGNGNNGTNSGVLWVPGVRGGAAQFNGTNSFIEANPLPDCASVTMSAWLFVTNLDSTIRRIFFEADTSVSHDLQLVLNTNNNLSFEVKTPDSITYSAVPSGRWFHCAGVADADNHRMQLWIDAVKVGEHAFSGQANVGYHYRLQIGRFYDSGNPASGYFKGMVDDLRVYNRALANNEIVLLANIGNFGLSFAEPTATRTNTWRVTSLAAGVLRGTNGSSIFYTFADDKNSNGLIDFADDFVTAEYLVTATNASSLTPSRHPIASPTVAQSYGLASVNFLNTGNEVFFTGEPDGQVFAWTGAGTTNPLSRQLFSGHHAGKAWHALAGVKTFEPGESLIGLRVDPTNQTRCDVILWSPQTQLPQLASLPNTAPSAAVLPTTNTLGSLALVTVRLWDAEGNASTPYLQFQLSGSTNWQYAALVSLDGAAYSTSARVATLPGGVNHTLLWNAATNLGVGVTTNVLLRARASDISLLGDWSAGTPFTVQTTANPDSDNDGILDSWEIQYFGNLVHSGFADSDGDGFTDFQEFIADTNPTNALSYLHFTSATRTPSGLVLNWQGGINATQFIERINNLTTNNWQRIFTNLPPTPISGSYTDAPGTNATQFYRIKATR